MTGDAILDMVLPAVGADIAGVVDAGALYVWAGQIGLSGTPAPTATLTVPGAKAAMLPVST